MVHVGMLLLTYAALVAQSSMRDAMVVHGIAPDFLALVVVAAAFGLKGAPAVGWAATAGLLADCFSSTQLGIRMLLATLMVAFVQTCIGAEWRKSVIVQTMFGCGMMCALLMGSEVAYLLLSRQPVVGPKFCPPLAATAVYSSALGLVLRMIWKLIVRVVPVRSTDPRPQSSGRWDVLSR